ncbi:hypothetical protein EHM69_01405 [candidate division KSB1 bacterium]|nr:MAG: hypothetical protein EHM69_01405 [candidate division KSB1 bacterium]
MSTTLTMLPKSNVLLILWLLLTGLACAETPAENLYSTLERRLQALNSLDIRYEARAESDNALIEGRLVWVKGDRFFHDTPEWSVCETGREQWRYLKTQNTLIRENISEQSDWLPEEVLFNARKNFRAVQLENRPDGDRVLTLEPFDKTLGGTVTLTFSADRDYPGALDLRPPDGTVMHYSVMVWNENGPIDSALFTPPEVPVENLLDFRGAGTSK